MFIMHNVRKTDEVKVMFIALKSTVSFVHISRVMSEFLCVIFVVLNRSARAPQVPIEIIYVACTSRLGVRTLNKRQILFHVHGVEISLIIIRSD